ncbi:MAG TPA: hypothetical protein DER33_09900 [Syntrophomonas sp.]|jgi:hypothetical protein|nr:hypothetical protein [Syntrophomonas sp.]
MSKFKFSGPARRLRIFIGEADRVKCTPLYHVLVVKAKEMDMAGVTVQKGIEGFGADSRIRTSRLVDVSSDLPVIVEIVDSEEYINRYLLEIDNLLTKGMVTIDDVEIIKYSDFEGDRLKRLHKFND